MDNVQGPTVLPMLQRTNRCIMDNGVYYEEQRIRDPNHDITVVEWVIMPRPSWIREEEE
uniref:Uncharacterized protein n=1 Tax=viral metagenome TaxID=1070528 RepID=A0A6C0CPW1_9ZZZZ